uniref:Uncharacterized protein n=1 Tax=Klebsiella pneumoniae TaxID=573 RepID=A0A8B0T065_KLEPN|nr:hypothetical protein [Klebsiella pneumoniae]
MRYCKFVLLLNQLARLKQRENLTFVIAELTICLCFFSNMI